MTSNLQEISRFGSNVERLKKVDLGEPTSFLDHVHLRGTQRQFDMSKDIVDNYTTKFESKNFRKSIGKTTKRGDIGDFHVVLRYGRSCQVCGTLL